MKAICLHSKAQIEQFLRRNTFLHIYALGDLDDFFWPYTTWYGLQDSQGYVAQLALLYSAMAKPVLLGITEEPTGMQELLQSVLPLLPRRFHAHLSGDVATPLADDYYVISHGLYYKMALLYRKRVEAVDASSVVPLSPGDLNALEELYRVSYPNNSFDPRMLETGCYYGIWQGSQIVSVAGIHVYSPKYRVAALGNVTTHPDFRGKGMGTAVCAKLCLALLQTVDHIGLNVKASNASAIASYKRLGFEIIATYGEYDFERHSKVPI